MLLLDEPSLGLSPLVCKELFQALGRIKDLGVGVLLVEQNASQSLEIGSRGYLLENGRIVGEGAAGDLQNDPAVRRAYLGGGLETGDALAPAQEWAHGRPRAAGRVRFCRTDAPLAPQRARRRATHLSARACPPANQNHTTP